MTKRDMENEVAKILCLKEDNISCDDCYSNNSRNNNYICKNKSQCRIAEKTEEQLDYILSSIKISTFLEACPGSGKTEVVGMKSAYEIKKWNSSKNGMAILTFTNDAADVIKERVNQFNPKASFHPHFIGTLSSFIHQYIAQPYGYSEIDYCGDNGDYSIKLIDSDLNVNINPWLNNYRCSIKYIDKKGKFLDIYAHQIFYNEKNDQFYIKLGKTNLSIEKYYESDQMQEYIKERRVAFKNNNYYKYDFFYQQFQKCKNNFLKDGFATYEDITCIAYQVLQNETKKIADKIAKKFTLIIVDECQDLSWIEIQILNKLRENGAVLHFVGDIHQSIFDFKEVALDSEYTINYLNGFNKLELTDNFRSCQPIVDLSINLISSDKKIIGIEENRFLENSTLYLEYKDPKEVVSKYFKILNHLGVNKEKSCIIVKQNTMKEKLLGDNNSEEHLLIAAIQLWNSGVAYQKKKALEYAGKQISKWFGGARNKSSYYCPKDITSVFAWRIFIKNILVECSNNVKLTDYTRKYGAWYSDARGELPNIIKKNYLTIENYDNLIRDFNKVFSARWYVGKSINEDINIIGNFEENDKHIQITTIHGSKGCTYDSTLVISSETINSESGHWKKHWIEGTIQDKRVGYVASTRAKYLLVWAIPTLKKDEKKLIESYGFRNYDSIF